MAGLEGDQGAGDPRDLPGAGALEHRGVVVRGGELVVWADGRVLAFPLDRRRRARLQLELAEDALRAEQVGDGQ